MSAFKSKLNENCQKMLILLDLSKLKLGRYIQQDWLVNEGRDHLGYVHTEPDKFENATFAAKTDKMFSVHINRFQTVSLSTLKRCLSPRTLARQSRF